MNAITQWWNTLGRDCTIEGEVGLRGLEKRLAEQCRDRLSSIICSGEITENTVLARMAKYIGTCNKKATLGSRTIGEKILKREKIRGTINRDKESKDLLDFLDSSSEIMCLVIGLNSVGKSTVIANALAQAGYQNVYRVGLVPHFINNATI